MRHQTIDELLPKADGSVYRLVRMASIRALELADGKPMLIDNPLVDKATTIALQEIAEGKVESKTTAEKRAKEEKKAK